MSIEFCKLKSHNNAWKYDIPTTNIFSTFDIENY